MMWYDKAILTPTKLIVNSQVTDAAGNKVTVIGVVAIKVGEGTGLYTVASFGIFETTGIELVFFRANESGSTMEIFTIPGFSNKMTFFGPNTLAWKEYDLMAVTFYDEVAAKLYLYTWTSTDTYASMYSSAENSDISILPYAVNIGD